MNSDLDNSDRVTTTFTTSVDVLLSGCTQHNSENILKRLESFKIKYLKMLEDIEQAKIRIEGSKIFSKPFIRDNILVLYRTKLVVAKQSMLKINEKILLIQQRLNNIRKILPLKKLSLVENGPFLYKCILPEGVRYRDYPSIKANTVHENLLTVTNNIVAFNEIVEIDERVFITSEQSVFLHRKGVGWLFENRKELVCFERIQ